MLRIGRFPRRMWCSRNWCRRLVASIACCGLISLPGLQGEEPLPVDIPLIPATIEGGVRAATETTQLLKRVVFIEDLDGAGRQFAPEQAAGAPTIKQAGDNGEAWASATPDDQAEWVLCSYKTPVKARAIMVYETYNPGALTKITAINPAGDEVVLWEGEDPTPRTKQLGISVIPVKADFPIQQIRLSIDSPAVPGWNEVDAVGLEGPDGQVQWASQVEASSTYAASRAGLNSINSKPAYGPEQVTGEPDTPGPGDQASAWASATTDEQPEWLICEYKTAQIPAEIVVYETNAPGAISKVSAFKPDGTEVPVWEGKDPTPPDQQWGISVFPVKVDFAFQKVKFYINSNEVPGYNEIDAVGLRADNGDIQWATGASASSVYGSAAFSMPNLRLSMMRAKSNPDPNFLQMQDEIKALRQQVEQLQKIADELKELKQMLQDKK